MMTIRPSATSIRGLEGFLHAGVSVVSDLACEQHHRADVAKYLCVSTTSTQPQDCITAPLKSHTEKNECFACVGLGCHFHRGRSESFATS